MHDSDMMIVIIMTTMLLLTVGLVSGNGGGVCGIVVDGSRIGAMGRSALMARTTWYIRAYTLSNSNTLMKIFYMRRAMALLAALRHGRISPAPNRAYRHHECEGASEETERAKFTSFRGTWSGYVGYCAARTIGEEICNCMYISIEYLQTSTRAYTIHCGICWKYVKILWSIC